MIFKTLDCIPKELGKQHKKASTKHLYRSNMMLNPLNLKHLNSIDNHQADMITLNLEDAIAPSRKREALENIGLFLSYLKDSNSFIIVRTNPLNDGGEEEIKFLNKFSFDAVRVAKIENSSQVSKALSILDEQKELHISLETKEAFSSIGSLRVDDRLTTANLGILDLLTSLGLPQSVVSIGNPTIDYILSKFLVESNIAGIRPISFMFQDYNNTKLFEEWCKYEKNMGFESKACMGPKQVSIANRIFSTDINDTIRAKEIKQLFEDSASRGINGFMHSLYGFIDEPIYRDALLTIKGKQ